MAKATLVLLVISLVGVMQWAKSTNAESWASRLEAEKENVTNLQFYFHDILSGKNPTAIKVAQPSADNKSPTLFGSIMMADDPLTEGPDPSSKPVGRAQGIYGSAGQNELALIMAMNFAFTDGIYNGSCISLLDVLEQQSDLRLLDNPFSSIFVSFLPWLSGILPPQSLIRFRREPIGAYSNKILYFNTPTFFTHTIPVTLINFMSTGKSFEDHPLLLKSLRDLQDLRSSRQTIH
ncbi:hypothetical protein D5086_018597 [Populus alba]|uniref:Uncharacterized protein n=1 Tax=Populus alba TaxID=43335 RepID=A0ACC4BRI2_POPAL